MGTMTYMGLWDSHLQLCDMMHAVRYIALKLSPFCLISKQLVSNLPQASRISKSLYRWMFRYWRMKKTTWSKTMYEIFTTDSNTNPPSPCLLCYKRESSFAPQGDCQTYGRVNELGKRRREFTLCSPPRSFWDPLLGREL